MPTSALFTCYEDLCKNDDNWLRLATLADIPADHGTGSPFKLSSRPIDAEIDQSIADQASEIYSRLVNQARAQLS